MLDIYHYAIISSFWGYPQEKQILHNYQLCYSKANFRTETDKSPLKFHQVSFREVETASCSFYFCDIAVLPFLFSNIWLMIFLI